MKAIEQVFPIELFIVLCKVVLTFKSVSEILTFQMKATERWYSVYLLKQFQAMWERVDPIWKMIYYRFDNHRADNQTRHRG